MTLKGKSTFIKHETDAFIPLIRKKLDSNTADQKKIRNQIRSIGFYASDFQISGGYTEDDFLRVVKII